MNRAIGFLVIIALFLSQGCSENESSPVPIIVSPVSGATYYPDQLIEIKWKVPDSTRTVEMQLLSSNDSLFFDKGAILFDTLQQSTFFTNQTSYKFYYGSPLDEKIYHGFRL